MSTAAGIIERDSPDREEVERAYEFCRRTARRHAKSFYFSAQFLPRAKRRPVYAVYALCRQVDDEVDEACVSDEDGARAAVERWGAELESVYKGRRAASPVLVAWADMLTTYPVRSELPLELMRGVLMDTHRKRYDTWDELRVYCYRVASVVGLMTSEIFGYSDPETPRYAEALGLAMQLTNILRDVGEDYSMGRVYLPREEMARFGVDESDLAAGRVTEGFRELMRFQISRARRLYTEAERGIPLLERDSRFTVLLASRLYARILREIERADFDVFTRRAHLTFAAKLLALPRVRAEARRL